MFKIGEKVVCTKTLIYSNSDLRTIEKDKIYTIKDVMKEDFIKYPIIIEEIEWAHFGVDCFVSRGKFRKQKIKKICSKLEIK